MNPDDPRSPYERTLFGVSHAIWLPLLLAVLALTAGALLGG